MFLTVAAFGNLPQIETFLRFEIGDANDFSRYKPRNRIRFTAIRKLRLEHICALRQR